MHVNLWFRRISFDHTARILIAKRPCWRVAAVVDVDVTVAVGIEVDVFEDEREFLSARCFEFPLFALERIFDVY